MAGWDHIPCGHCGKPLPPNGNKRRRVPRLGGQSRLVHEACAKEIDEQGVLELTSEDGERAA